MGSTRGTEHEGKERTWPHNCLLLLFDVLTAVSVKSTVFRVVPQCSSERDRCFGGIYTFHLQNARVSEAWYQQKAELTLRPASSGFLLGLGQTDICVLRHWRGKSWIIARGTEAKAFTRNVFFSSQE